MRALAAAKPRSVRPPQLLDLSMVPAAVTPEVAMRRGGGEGESTSSSRTTISTATAAGGGLTVLHKGLVFGGRSYACGVDRCFTVTCRMVVVGDEKL